MVETTSRADGEPPVRRWILCIDGGGLLGTFLAAVLAGLEEHVEEPFGRFFDLIAGTSTGGTIALSLGLRFTRARKRLPIIQRVFLDAPVEPYIPCHPLGEGDRT